MSDEAFEGWESYLYNPPNWKCYKDQRVPRHYVVFWIDDQDLSYLMNPGTLRFNSYDEAESYIRANLLCESCVNQVSRGLDPRATPCYSQAVIWSERRLRRDLNGAWLNERRKHYRREHNPGYKRLRRR